MIEGPQWLNQASLAYQGLGDPKYNCTETNWQRGSTEIAYLQSARLPEPRNRIDILLVGIGMGVEDILCPILPYRIAAYLEGRGIPYRLALVDRDPDIIADISTRQQIFIDSDDLRGSNSLLIEWEGYLSDTGQTDRVLKEREEGLRFLDYIEERRWGSQTPFTPEGYIRGGVHAAQIPRTFASQLQTGEILLVPDDIARAKLTGRQYHFVSCLNVFYLMDSNGQKLALANMARQCLPGGIILIDDLPYISETPLLKEFGGWLSETELSELGLRMDEILFKDESSCVFTLRKIGQ